MSRSNGRRRPINRNRADGKWAGYGRQERDAVSGWYFPRQWMVKQCGGLVSRDPRDGSLDRKDGRLDNACPIGRAAPPVLSIEATDDSAVEGLSTGTFTISSTKAPASALTVYLVISGTATNGTDYTAIPPTVTLPAGQTSVTITVTATDDGASEVAETVIVTLDPPVHHSNYYIDADNATATVTIAASTATGELLLIYKFEDSPGVLVNSGTLGTAYNLIEDVVCES